MSFRRFIDIILRNMLLNAWLFALLFSISLPLNGDIYFFDSVQLHNLILVAMLAVCNILHWCLEIIAFKIKFQPDEDLE